jgi:hypothetical protein
MAIFSRAFVRRRIISLAASLSVSATSFALAQDPGEAHHLRTPVNDTGERQFQSDASTPDDSRLITPETTPTLIPTNSATGPRQGCHRQ